MSQHFVPKLSFSHLLKGETGTGTRRPWEQDDPGNKIGKKIDRHLRIEGCLSKTTATEIITRRRGKKGGKKIIKNCKRKALKMTRLNAWRLITEVHLMLEKFEKFLLTATNFSQVLEFVQTKSN